MPGFGKKFTRDGNNAIKKYDVNVFRDFGVQRTNINRDQWSKLWDAQMNENMCDNPMPNKDCRIDKKFFTISLDKLIKIKIDMVYKSFFMCNLEVKIMNLLWIIKLS